jgi:hypothetical protein
LKTAAAKLPKIYKRLKSAQKQAAEAQTTFHTLVAAADSILRFSYRMKNSAKI